MLQHIMSTIRWEPTRSSFVAFFQNSICLRTTATPVYVLSVRIMDILMMKMKRMKIDPLGISCQTQRNQKKRAVKLIAPLEPHWSLFPLFNNVQALPRLLHLFLLHVPDFTNS